jgi:hypothetical protein
VGEMRIFLMLKHVAYIVIVMLYRVKEIQIEKGVVLYLEQVGW